MQAVATQINIPGETRLLNALHHEIRNFSGGAAGYFKRTLLLTPYASECFGFDASPEEVTLGVPDALYEPFLHTRWSEAAFKAKRPSLYLLFNLEGAIGSRPCALSIVARPARVALLGGRSEICIARMVRDERGRHVASADPRDRFYLPVRQINELDWETE